MSTTATSTTQTNQTNPSTFRVLSPSGRYFHEHRSLLPALREAQELGLSLEEGDTGEVLCLPEDPSTFHPVFKEWIREELKAEAERDHEDYPQYRGRWNGWELARVKRDIRTKGGLAAREGDLVLREPRILSVIHNDTRALFYSWRRRINTEVKTWDLEAL